jgi:energy-coupling factor transporter ATP-binding protein EcfA2
MIDIRNLTKIYGDKKAVDDLTLHIEKGEMYAFIGHNGAGKTTTIKSICGLLDFDGGEIFVDGNGSVFPIGVVNCPGKPLWWVYYDSIDPLVDPFDEDHVEIKFNSAHPNYEALKIEGSLKESPLFLEVISAALMIIVESVKESASTEWDNILNGNGFERGSIAEAVYYFISKLQWDPASPVSLASSIHTFFDNHLQGGSL